MVFWVTEQLQPGTLLMSRDAGLLRKSSLCFTSEQPHLLKSLVLLLFPVLHDEIKHRSDKAAVSAEAVIPSGAIGHRESDEWSPQPIQISSSFSYLVPSPPVLLFSVLLGVLILGLSGKFPWVVYLLAHH